MDALRPVYADIARDSRRYALVVIHKCLRYTASPFVPTGSAQKHADMQTFQVFKTWKV